MRNMPTIKEQGKLFKSQFYYLSYKEAEIPDVEGEQAICVVHYHEEPLSHKEYQELSASKTLLNYNDWGNVNFNFIIPTSREEYIIRSRAIQEETDIKLSVFEKVLITPPSIQRVAWVVTFGFLISLIIGIYGFNMFGQGFSFRVGIVILVLLIGWALLTLGIALVRIFYGMRLAHGFTHIQDEKLYRAGRVVWSAIDNNRITDELIKDALDSVDDDDALAVTILAGLCVTDSITMQTFTAKIEGTFEK